MSPIKPVRVLCLRATFAYGQRNIRSAPLSLPYGAVKRKLPGPLPNCHRTATSNCNAGSGTHSKGSPLPSLRIFLPETQQTNDLYKSIESRRDSTKDSALAVLYDMITADGYQLSVNTGKYNQRADSVLYNIAGKLVGHGMFHAFIR